MPDLSSSPFPFGPPYDTNAILSDLVNGNLIKERNPDSFMLIVDQAYFQSAQIGFRKGIIYALMLKGSGYEMLGKGRIALAAYEDALALAKNGAASRIYLPWILLETGNIYNNFADYQSALSHYLRAMSIAEELLQDTSLRREDYARVVQTHITIQNNFTKQLLDAGQFQQVLHYLDKLEQSAARLGNFPILGYVLVNKAYYYTHIKDWSTAAAYCQKALSIARMHQLPHLELLSLLDLGIVELKTGHYRAAQGYLEAARKSPGTSASYEERNGVLLGLGEVYLQLGDYTQARQMLKMAEMQAETLGLRNNLKQIFSVLAAVHTRAGNYKEALEYTLKYSRLKDSIQGEAVLSKLNALEVGYRTAEKDKEIAVNQLTIAQQQKNIERRNGILWIAVLGSSVLVIALFSLYFSFRQRKRLQLTAIKLLQQEKQFLKQEKELERMKALLEGEERERGRIARDIHDGVAGQLVAISMNFNLVKKEHAQLQRSPLYMEALTQLDEVAVELRETTHNLMPEILLRQGLAESLYLFCKRQQRSGMLEIEFQCGVAIERFNPEYEMAIYRMTQELVFNVIKHAGASVALVQLNQFENMLSITVEDNGAGFDDAAYNSKSGTGLRTIRDRVRAMEGHFDIRNSPSGVSVYLEFSLLFLRNNGEAWASRL